MLFKETLNGKGKGNMRRGIKVPQIGHIGIFILNPNKWLGRRGIIWSYSGGGEIGEEERKSMKYIGISTRSLY